MNSVLSLVPSLDNEGCIFVFHTITKQSLTGLLFVVIVVQDFLESFLQFSSESFSDSVASEVCKNQI